jgi:hypothetical protein
MIFTGIEVEELHDLLSIHSIMANDKLRIDDVRNVNLTAELNIWQISKFKGHNSTKNRWNET